MFQVDKRITALFLILVFGLGVLFVRFPAFGSSAAKLTRLVKVHGRATFRLPNAESKIFGNTALSGSESDMVIEDEEGPSLSKDLLTTKETVAYPQNFHAPLTFRIPHVPKVSTHIFISVLNL